MCNVTNRNANIQSTLKTISLESAGTKLTESGLVSPFKLLFLTTK